MLTLKEPIQTKARSPVNQSFVEFGEKILHNYGLISLPMEAEDLLHVVTVPLEIYLGEGGITNLFSTAEVRNEQEWKLEVINQVLNRILISDSNKFTYQDIVYISSVLRKLGIYNEQEFMKQVKELRVESRNTNEMINLYWSHGGELQTVIETVKQGVRETAATPGEENPPAQERYYLQESIFTRLQTAAVYQLLKSFYQYQAAGAERISQAELRIAEQTNLSQKMLLQKLKNVTLVDNKALLYHHINIYEMGEEPDDQPVTEQTVVAEMAAAVLLNLVDNLYAARVEQLESTHEHWLRVTDALFLSSENTINRYESYHRELKSAGEEARSYLTQMNRHTNEEILLLQNFIEQTIPLYYSTSDAAQLPEEWAQQVARVERIVTEQPELHRAEPGVPGDTVYRAGDVYNDLHENTQMEHRQFQSIEEQTAYYEQQNRMIREQLVKLEAERPKTSTVRVDREKARRDSLRALENPEALIQEYMEENTRVEQETLHTQRQYERLMSAETKSILERIEQYRMSPSQAGEAGIIAGNAESMLQAETNEPGRIVLEYPQTDEERARALENGEVVEDIAHRVTQRIYRDWVKEQSETAPDGVNTPLVNRTPAGGDGVEAEEVHRFLEAAGTQLIYHESLRETGADTQRVREVIDGVDRMLHFYQVDNREIRLAEAKIVHKQLKQELDEETIQEMIRLNTKRQKTEVAETVVKQDSVKETIVNTTSREIVQQNTENIAEMVQKGVRGEMAAISEQVYRKLEQRLKNEKSRRGF